MKATVFIFHNISNCNSQTFIQMYWFLVLNRACKSKWHANSVEFQHNAPCCLAILQIVQIVIYLLTKKVFPLKLFMQVWISSFKYSSDFQVTCHSGALVKQDIAKQIRFLNKSDRKVHLTNTDNRTCKLVLRLQIQKKWHFQMNNSFNA